MVRFIKVKDYLTDDDMIINITKIRVVEKDRLKRVRITLDDGSIEFTEESIDDIYNKIEAVNREEVLR